MVQMLRDGYKRRSEPAASGILIGLMDVMWVVLSVHAPGGGTGHGAAVAR